MPFVLSRAHAIPMLDRRSALFLDLDGTLSHLAPTPGEAVIDAPVLSAVAQIQAALRGAVAIVSGRPIQQIDQLCYPWHFTAAGQHGLELRQNEAVRILATETDALQNLKQDVAEFHAANPEVLLEYKGLSIAIHYRQAPEMADAVMAYAAQIAVKYTAFHIQHGKMVCEIRLQGADKGVAIATLMQDAPFAAKIPVFIGDDTTDEDAFQVVNNMQGITIKVGTGETVAKHRLASVNDVHSWLADNAQRLTARVGVPS